MNLLKTVRSSLFGLAIFATAFAAKADVVYSFDATAVVPFGAGPYGTVTLTENITGGVDFLVGLRSDLDFVNTGGPHTVFSFNALDVATGDVTNVLFNSVSGSSLGFTVTTGAGNAPYGTFSLGIDCTADRPLCKNGAPGATVDPLSFTVSNSRYTDFGFVLVGSSAFFASDVICTTGDCFGSTGSIAVTGTDRPPQEIPEPAPLALMGLGMLALAASRRRRG